MWSSSSHVSVNVSPMNNNGDFGSPIQSKDACLPSWIPSQPSHYSLVFHIWILSQQPSSGLCIVLRGGVNIFGPRHHSLSLCVCKYLKKLRVEAILESFRNSVFMSIFKGNTRKGVVVEEDEILKESTNMSANFNRKMNIQKRNRGICKARCSREICEPVVVEDVPKEE